MSELWTTQWDDYDYHNRILNAQNHTWDDIDMHLERYPLHKFRREMVVFRTAHFKRIVGLSKAIELPLNSTIHLMDNIDKNESEYIDTPRLSEDIWTGRESSRIMLHHVKQPFTNGVIEFSDRYAYISSGLPSALMKHRTSLPSKYKLAPNLDNLATAPNVLNVINHNPVFRARVFGQLQYFKKIQLVLSSVFNTVEQLADKGREQFIEIPWTTDTYNRTLFNRTQFALSTSTLKRPNDYAYIVLMHVLNYIYSELKTGASTTSILSKLSDDTLKKTHLLFRTAGDEVKYVCYNLFDLKEVGLPNRIYLNVLNQMNMLAITGRDTADKATLANHLTISEETTTSTDDTPSEVDTSPDMTTYELPEDTTIDISPSTDVDSAVRDAEVIKKLDTAIVKKHNPFKYISREKKVVTTASPKVVVSKVKKGEIVTSEVPAAIADKVISVPNKTPVTDVSDITSSYVLSVDKDTEAYIDSKDSLTPAQKDRYKMLSQRYKNLTLGDRTLGDILDQDNDISFEESVLPESIGYLPDKSALKSSITEFDKAYIAKSFHRNLIGGLLAFHRHGAFLVGIKEEKVVSHLSNITQYSFQFEDVNGKKTTIKAAIPSVDYHGRIKVDGKTHVLKKQRVNKPIIKIAPDKVSLTTNYNKARVIRNSSKAHSFLSYVDSYINNPERSVATITYGSCQINTLLPYEYSILADKYRHIEFSDSQGRQWFLNFDYANREEAFTSRNGKEGVLTTIESQYGTYIGTDGEHFYFMDNRNTINSLTVNLSEALGNPYASLWDILKLSLKPEVKVSKQLTEWVDFVYLSKSFPVMFILAYRYGLIPMLNYLGIDYSITEGRSKSIIRGKYTPLEDVHNESYGVEDIYLEAYSDFGVTDIGNGVKLYDDKYEIYPAEVARKALDYPGMSDQIARAMKEVDDAERSYHNPHHKELLYQTDIQSPVIHQAFDKLLVIYEGTLVAFHEYEICETQSHIRLGQYWVSPSHSGVNLERMMVRYLSQYAMDQCIWAMVVSAFYHSRYDGHKVYLEQGYNPSSSTERIYIEPSVLMQMKVPEFTSVHAGVYRDTRVMWVNNIPFSVQVHEGYLFVEKYTSPSCKLLNAEMKAIVKYFTETIAGYSPKLIVVRIVGRFASDIPDGWHKLSWSMIGDSRIINNVGAFRHNSTIDTYNESLSNYVPHIAHGDKSEYFYHISLNDLGEKFEFTPRIPEVTLSDVEDQVVPRVCVSTSVEGCILGCPYIFASPDKADGDGRFRSRVANCFVYAIRKDQLSPSDIISSKDLVSRQLVFDADVTDEVWVTTNVTMECIGKIRVTNNKDSIPIEYTDVYGVSQATWLFPHKWTEGPTIDIGPNIVSDGIGTEYALGILRNILNQVIAHYGLEGHSITLDFSEYPVDSNGERYDEIPIEQFAGCVTRDNKVYVATPANMVVTMNTWGVSDKYTLTRFYTLIIAHELAHIKWKQVLSSSDKERALSYIPADFTTEYLSSYSTTDSNYDEEKYCEWQAYSYLGLISIEYRYMDFPSGEIDTLKHQDRVITTRVSAELGKYRIGDKVTTPWGKKYEVTSVERYTDIKDHPYYDDPEFTEDMKAEVMQYPEFDVVTLHVINDRIKPKSATPLLAGATDMTKRFFNKKDLEEYDGRSRDISRVLYLDSLDALNLNTEEYCIGGSGALSLYKHPDPNKDLDIVVFHQGTIDRLLDQGLIKQGNQDGIHDKMYQSMDGHIDISTPDVSHLDWDIDTYLKRSSVVDGYRFLTWSGLYVFYKELYVSLGKQKHLNTIGWMDEEDNTLSTRNKIAPKYQPKSNDIRIPFADAVLWINRYPTDHSLIVAGLDSFDLTKYNIADMDSKDAYYRLMQDKKQSINYLKGIDSFFDLFIDNIAYTDLSIMGEPTNVRDLLIRAVGMLTTLEHIPSSSAENHKIRGYEQFNAIVYNEMARQFAAYQARRGKANVFSLSPDAIYLRIVKNAAMVPSDAVNPLQDIKETTYLTHSGVGGRTSESFVIEDRKYTASDIGIISEATPDNQKVAISAQLSLDPTIDSTAGHTRSKPISEIEPANALSIHALTFPFATNDDEYNLSYRTVMHG